MVDLMVLAAVVFAFGLVSRRLEGTVLTAPIVFVVAGFVLGPWGLGLVEFELDSHTVLLVGEIALAIVLFTDAASTNLSALRQNEALPLRLLGIGMPLTIVLGTVVAALLLTDLTFWEAAIVGVVLAPTDAALGQAVVSNPRLPLRMRQALGVEAGLNDGLSVPFLALFLTLAEAQEEHLSADIWVRFALEQIGFGILVGVGVGLVGGWLVRWASQRGWMTDSFRRLALLALAIIAWALADQIGGNGFIAAFVGGLLIGPTVKRLGERVIRFTEAEGQLLSLSVFFIFGVPRARGDPTLELGGCPLCPPEPHPDPYAARGAFPIWNASARRLCSIRGLVRPARAGLDSVGPDRGGGGSAAPRARRDRGGGSADGAAQCAAARGYGCPLSAVYARRVRGMEADAQEKQGTVEAPTHGGSVPPGIKRGG